MAEAKSAIERGTDESVSSDEEVREKPSSLKQTTGEGDVPEMTLAMLMEELDTITDPLKLGLCLGIKQHFIDTIQANHRNHVEGQRREVFRHIAYNNISLDITWSKITRVLEEHLNMGDLARVIRTKFNCQLQDCSPCPAPTVNPKLSSYRNYLRSRYKTVFTPVNQWPPVPVTKVFKLALIKKEKIQRGKIDDDFVRMSITGKVDDILQRKAPVDLGNIFSETEDDRKFVLIEGAPGSGKSTLASHMCQEWGKGNLFQDYDNVILVRLRDPLVREAKSVADLLPCANEAMAKNAEAAITSLYGKGVLWVLDGWDELPSDLPQDSIINKLVRPGLSQESPLHECAVIITSRPSSSAKLHPLVSSRVEVLGFTPHELEQYLTHTLDGDVCAVQDLLKRIRENPVVEGSCYLPLNAAIIAHVFLSDKHTLPTALHGIFSSVVQCFLNRHLQEKLGKTTQVRDIISTDTIPSELKAQFTHLCKLAFYGVQNDKVTFTADDLTSLGIPTDICDVGLLQAVTSILSVGPQVYYCFLHLSIQELLAAIHISHMSPDDQISVFNKLFGQARFSAVFQFYAGITKLRTSRPFLSKLPRFLCPVPTSIFDLVEKIVRQESSKSYNEPKPLLVSLLNCLYEAEDPDLLAKLINEPKLNLYHTTLSPLDCLSVGYSVSVVSTTTRGQFTVVLSNCSIDDQGCKFLTRGLCKCLSSHSTVTSQLGLDLGSNNIHEEGVHHISQLLNNASIVHKLVLSSNAIGRDGLKSLCEALVTNNTLEELQLSKCTITISLANGSILSELLIRNNSLATLDLSGNNLTDCRHLARGLEKNKSLRCLNLSHNPICGDGLKSLCEALVTNNTLEQLQLSYCLITISLANGPFLSELLIRNNSLVTLNLSQNNLTDCRHLARGLEKNKSLRCLNLSYNPICGDGLKSLCEALVTNNTLEQLQLSYCLITISLANGPFLSELLIRNNSLATLNLSWSYLTDCHHLARGLKYNTSLKLLILAKCGLNDQNVEDLCVGLNNYIERLDIGGNDVITIKGLTTLASHLTTPTRLSWLEIPKHLKSSIPTVFSEVNKERKRSGLPEIIVFAFW